MMLFTPHMPDLNLSTVQDAQPLFGIGDVGKLEAFSQLDFSAANDAVPAPGPDNSEVPGTLPDGPCTSDLDTQPPAPVPVEDPAVQAESDDDHPLQMTPASGFGAGMMVSSEGGTPAPGGLARMGSEGDLQPIPQGHQNIGAPPGNQGAGAVNSSSTYTSVDDAALRAQYGEPVDQVTIGESDFFTVTSYERVTESGITLRTNVTTLPDGRIQPSQPVVVAPPPRAPAAAGGGHGGGLFDIGGGGGGGGPSFGTQALIGTGVTVLAGGTGLGIWAAADPKGFHDAFTADSSAPAPHDPGANAPLTVQPVASIGEPVSPPPVSLTTTIAPPASTGHAFAPEWGGPQLIPDTRTCLIVELPSPGDGAVVRPPGADDVPAIRELVLRWISQVAPDSSASLDGFDFVDMGDGSGLSLMVQLNVYLNPSTGFNSALTAESVALLDSALQHMGESMPAEVPELALVGMNLSTVTH